MRKILVALLLVGLLLFSCRTNTVYVPVENVRTEKEYIDRWQRDSVYLHDSIFVAQRGDTIWLEKYKTLYKEVIRHDSVFVTDSIRIEVPYPMVEVKEVNRLRTWQILLMCLGGVLIGATAYRILRWWKK